MVARLESLCVKPLGWTQSCLMLLPAAPADKTGWPWECNSPSIFSSSLAYPKISIVTPTFRHGRYLEETIRSVLLQGYPNLEYIVIDGGSQDETVEILERYNQSISYWVSEPDRGHAHALNKGFARSTGEILAWINAGDFYFPQALHRVAQAFQTFSEIAWITSAQPGRHEPDADAFTYSMPGFSRTFFMAGGYLGFEAYSLGFIQQESTFWRKSLWEKAGGNINETLRMANDFELWKRFFAYTKLALLDAPIACFRVHDDQRSATQAALYRQEAWSCLQRKGNPWLALAYRLYQKLRLHKLMTWRAWLKPFYGENIQVIGFENAEKNSERWFCEWQKLL